MGIIQRIFTKGNRQQQPRSLGKAEVMNGSPAIFNPFSGNAYESDIYRSAVDAIARNCAKLKPTHIITLEGQRKDGDSKLNRILQVRPNPYMTSYDLIYKLVTHYYLYNNAFAYLQKDNKGNLTGIYPLRPVSMEYISDPTGNLYCKFLFKNREPVILNFREVFTIRRFFNSNDLLGDMNTAILPTLELAHTQSEGIRNSIKSNANIRGILKYNQVLNQETLRAEKQAFVDDYLNIDNNGGVAALDSKFDYIPLDSKPIHINDKQLQAVKSKIYDYLGISENIVNSTYSEEEWSGFYESIIEGLGLQIGLELTEKTFTKREHSFGNSIILEANRLQFASTKTKTDLLLNLLPMGVISINEAREILNVPSIEGGDKYIQSLNYVNKAIADKYQLKGKGGQADEGNQECNN